MASGNLIQNGLTLTKIWTNPNGEVAQSGGTYSVPGIQNNRAIIVVYIDTSVQRRRQSVIILQQNYGYGCPLVHFYEGSSNREGYRRITIGIDQITISDGSYPASTSSNNQVSIPIQLWGIN